MEWLLCLVLVLIAYFLGHWRGYGRGESDRQEFIDAQATLTPLELLRKKVDEKAPAREKFRKENPNWQPFEGKE